jgi:hypothetical protein
MQFSEQNNKGYCVICGKEVPVRDVRAKKGTYCSRICAQQTRYQRRFRGSNAGPADRPMSSRPVERTKF